IGRFTISSGHSIRCNNMAFIYKHVRDPLDKLLVLVESPTHLSKISLVWTKLLGCNNKYIACLSLVLKDKPWTIVSKINQYRINLETYLPIIRIIGTIFIYFN